MTAEPRRAAMPRPRKVNHDLVAAVEAYMAPALCPAAMLTGEESTEPARWYALKVTPGQEAIAAAHLAGRGFGCYLPMERARKGAQGLKPTFPIPQMAGYILAWVKPVDLSRVRYVPGVTGILKSDEGTPLTVSDAAVNRCRQIEVDTDAALAWHLEKTEAAKKAKEAAIRAAAAPPTPVVRANSAAKDKARRQAKKRRRRRARRARPSKQI